MVWTDARFPASILAMYFPKFLHETQNGKNKTSTPNLTAIPNTDVSMLT